MYIYIYAYIYTHIYTNISQVDEAYRVGGGEGVYTPVRIRAVDGVVAHQDADLRLERLHLALLDQRLVPQICHHLSKECASLGV